ncbi:hypothetical protein [Phytohabitans aurantiacus]|nr:hypothetical protein [Phytohabitans aurantiacus]
MSATSNTVSTSRPVVLPVTSMPDTTSVVIHSAIALITSRMRNPTIITS